jgi:hypothetical protein
MDLAAIALRVAGRIASSTHESLTRPLTEYSVRMDISFSADFEGTVAKNLLVDKIESEVVSALESSIKIISRELKLDPGRVLVKPLRIEVAMNDQASLEESGEDDSQEQ